MRAFSETKQPLHYTFYIAVKHICMLKLGSVQFHWITIIPYNNNQLLKKNHRAYLFVSKTS